MAVIKSVIPRSLFTQNQLAGDPGRRSLVTHRVPSVKSLDQAMLDANYGDDILVDHTVTTAGMFRSNWKDYRARTINASTPRQITRSQLLRPAEDYDPATMDPQRPIEEEIVVAQSAITTQSALVAQTIAPQGEPSFIRIMSDSLVGTYNGVPVAVKMPGQRASLLDTLTPYATFTSTAGNNAIFAQEAGEFGGAGSPNSYRYWWFEGLRFARQSGTGGAQPFFFWALGSGPTGAWQSYRQLPHYFMVHRCVWDGDSFGAGQLGSWERAVQWEGHAFGVVDSGVWKLYGGGTGDNGVFQSPYGGSYQLQNVYAEGLTGLMFTGGTGHGIQGRNAGPNILRRVHFRKPRRWQRSEIASGFFAGSGGPEPGWGTTIAADRVSVSRSRSVCDFNGSYVGPGSFIADTFIGAGMIMYDPTTGLGAQVSASISANALVLAEPWAGTVPATLTVYFQSASTVYHSGRPGLSGTATTATTSSSSATVTFNAALPASVTTDHYFRLNNAAFSDPATPPFRRRITAIAGNRLSCTLDGNYNVSTTFPFSIVWWDGIARNNVVTKSAYENKSCKGGLLEDLVMENTPRGAWGTTGFVLHPTSQSNDTPWSELSDIRLRYARTTRMGGHSIPTYTPNVDKMRSTGRYTMQHLLLDDLNNVDLDVTRAGQVSAGWNIKYNTVGVGDAREQVDGPEVIEHVTSVKDSGPDRLVFYLSDAPSLTVKPANQTYRDSIYQLPGANSSFFQAPAVAVLSVLETPTIQRMIGFGPNAPAQAILASNAPAELYGVPDQINIGFANYAGGDYRLVDLYQTNAGACTISGATVTISGGTFPTTLVRDVPFRATVDGPLYVTKVLSRDSATQVTLQAAYPGTTGAGLTGLFTFKGTASDGSVGPIHTTAAGDCTVTNIPSASYSEAFTRADGAGLTGLAQTWTQTLGTAFGIASNAAQVQTTGATQMAICQTTLRSASHYAQVTLSTFVQASNALGGLMICAAANGTTFYALWAIPGGMELWKWVSGTKTNLGTSGVGCVQGDVLKLEYTLSTQTLRASVNGTTRITVVDASIPANNFAGILGLRGSGGDAVSLDTFSAATNVALDISLVTLTSGTFPLTVDPTRGARTFKVSGDAATAETGIASYDSATQLQLAAAYPGTTGSGLTGEISGLIPSGKDPGCDIATLTARLAGVVQEFTP